MKKVIVLLGITIHFFLLSKAEFYYKMHLNVTFIFLCMVTDIHNGYRTKMKSSINLQKLNIFTK